jgi:transcriptional regulator of aromatic amino acid metabolism
MTPLIFKHYDHAVIFKVLNNLPSTVKIRYIDYSHTAIYYKDKIYKINTKNIQCESWIVKK